MSKAIQALEPHTIKFIEHCPFIIVSTIDPNGFVDVSPRGGQPGFVKVIDNQTIAFPDSSGNNRLDSLRNIIELTTGWAIVCHPWDQRNCKD